MRRFSVLLLFALFCLLAVDAAAAFTRELDVATATLRLVDLVGTIHVVPAAGDAFHVTVKVDGKDASPDLIRVRRRGETVVVAFPVGKHRRYVYPGLSGDKVTFRPARDRRGMPWWRRLIGAVGGQRITVVRKGRGCEAWADVEIRVPRGKRVQVVDGAGSINVQDVTGDVSCTLSCGPVTAASVVGSLTAGTGSGRVTCRDIRGRVDVDTGSGAVEARNCRGELFRADTGSGHITLGDVDVRRVDLDTGSGGVSAAGLGADGGVIDTGSGSVEMTLVRLGGGKLTIDTGSGGIDLTVPRTIDTKIHADTGSGGVEFTLPDARVEHREGDDVRLVLGSGEGRIDLDTGSCSIV